jgi:uncharacterized protein YndB with AHSA1/START domain
MTPNPTMQKPSPKAAAKPGAKPAELKLERIFNATPKKLYTYWTDPKKYAKWFNPAGLDLVIHEFDVRVGGRIRFDMPQPDGNPNPQEGVFHKLAPFDQIVTGSPDKSFLMTVDFQEMTAKMTRMIVTVVGVPAEYHDMATQGWSKGFDHLERELGTGSALPKVTGKPNVGFTIERILKASPEKVWKLWTTKAGIESWWGPAAKEMGMDLKVLKLDVKPGGKYAIQMKDAKVALVNHGHYKTVEPNRRLTQVWEFDIFLAPGEKPYDVAISIDLEPVGKGTKLTFKQGPLATVEHTEGSREGVGRNLTQLQRVAEA